MHEVSAVKSYFRYWAKAEKSGVGLHLLPYHCLDVAAVGHALLDLLPGLLSSFSECACLAAGPLRRLLTLFLSLHDVGKLSVTFQNQRPDMLESLQGRISSRNYTIRHDSLGYSLWTDHLWHAFKDTACSNQSSFRHYEGYWEEILGCIARAVSGHHGSPPRLTEPNRMRVKASRYFDQADLSAALELLHDFCLCLTEGFEFLNDLEPIKFYESIQKTSWLLAGFVVLSDWIASSDRWFPYCESPMPISDYWYSRALPQAERAVRETGIDLLGPKRIPSTFTDLFPLIEEPTPLQHYAMGCPLAHSPRLFILEDVTGAGKTEAALLLAQRLMAEGQGSGVFMALPTMATSNAMYERVAGMYRKLFADDSSPSLILAHGARHLSKSFMSSVAGFDSGSQSHDINEETAGSQCASWLADSRKKALLADFGVGTLDQALLAILPSRFQSLRLFGLIRHVLIVDEVHAYDAYMNRLLQTLLSFHAALGGSAILLSATLPKRVRQDIVASFAKGLEIPSTPGAASGAYPLASCFSRSHGCIEVPIDAFAQRRSSVAIRIVPERDEIEQSIVSAAKQGMCVCWIRNTVHDAISGFESLAQKAGIENLTLFHSRFVMGDRLEIEANVCDAFGKKSGEAERSGKILISTQVVEQSLDLDFDLLISDLAPMDLLIQRAGRLHRHLRDEKGNLISEASGPDQRSAPNFVIHGPLPESDAAGKWYESAFPKAALVYQSHGCLWLTARMLSDKGVLRMPDDARELVEAAFSEEADRLIPKELRDRDIEAEAKWQAERSMANINELKLDHGYEATPAQWLDDVRTPTRLGDAETTVRLARWDGKRLTPWCSVGDYRWDMSQVNIRTSLVAAEAKQEDAVLMAEIDSLKSRLPDKGKWSVLVPLRASKGGVWQGAAVDRSGQPVIVSYSPRLGVSVTRKGE